MSKSRFLRPKHKKDDGHAHIKFGQDPRPNLKKYGYCVVEEVFTKAECRSTINDIWKWLEGLGTGVKRKDKKTWSNQYWPHTVKQGMIQHTLGQEEFMWKIREHKNVYSIYKKIFGTKKLVVSFDGAMFGRPPETGYVQSPKTSWVHTDQNLIKNVKLADVYNSDYYSIQGIANFEECGDNDASLFIGEKSHLIHNTLFKHIKKEPKSNWYLLTKKDMDYVIDTKKIQFTKVNAPAGSFIMFDSRCLHSGFPSQGKRDKDQQRFRYVIYVAMTPSSRMKPVDINKKIKAVKEGRVTTHWSSNNVKLFPYPQTYGKDCPYLKRKQNIPDYKNWSDNRKKLAGVIPY